MDGNSLQGEKVTEDMDNAMRDRKILQVFKGESCEKQPDSTDTWRGALGTSGELRWQGLGNHFSNTWYG